MWPASMDQAAEGLAGARGSLRHDLALREASGEPARRSLWATMFSTQQWDVARATTELERSATAVEIGEDAAPVWPSAEARHEQPDEAGGVVQQQQRAHCLREADAVLQQAAGKDQQEGLHEPRLPPEHEGQEHHGEGHDLRQAAEGDAPARVAVRQLMAEAPPGSCGLNAVSHAHHIARTTNAGVLTLMLGVAGCPRVQRARSSERRCGVLRADRRGLLARVHVRCICSGRPLSLPYRTVPYVSSCTCTFYP